MRFCKITEPKILKYRLDAFTLAELLIALMVTSIVLTAVATLAYALGSVNDNDNDIAHQQSRLRCTTLRISELIRNCKLVCGIPGTDLVVWKTDSNGDNKINPGELVYIESGWARNRIRLLEFSPRSSWFENYSFEIQDIKSGQAKILLWLWCNWNYMTLIPQCSSVQFLLDGSPPDTQFVSISFDLEQGGAINHYQINAALKAWAGNLIDSSGEIVNTDDD